MVQLVNPRTGPVLTIGASYEKTWQRSTRRCYIQNIKALSLPVSEKKNYETFVLCSCVQLVIPQGRANFDPRGIIWTNLVEVHKEMLYTKYQSSSPSSFKEEKFWNFHSLFLCFNSWAPGQGHPPGWLSGERVGLMTWWLWVRSQVEATFLSGVFSPLTSAEACEKSSRWLWKKSSVSTGVRKPGNTYASPTAMIWP